MSALTRLLSRLLPAGRKGEPLTHTSFKEYQLTPTKRSEEKLLTRAGYGGKEIAGKFWFLPYDNDKTGETETMRTAYRAMLKSPYIKSPLMMKILSVASLDWQIIPENQGSPRDVECGQFLRHCIERLNGGLPDLAMTCLGPSLIEGYGVAEKVLEIERVAPKWRGKAVLKAVKTKTTDLYNLQVDEFNNVLGVQGKGVNDADCYYPINEFIYSRHMAIYDEPKGMSDLRAAYQGYWLLDTVLKLRAIHNEKYTTPFLMGTYVEQEQKGSLEAALQAAKANTWITIPDGAKVEAVTMAGQGESDYKSFCDDAKRDMLIAIIGAYLQVLEGQVSDGRGNADVSSKDVTSLFQWMLAARFQEIVNKQIFPELVALNYAGVGSFRLVLGGVDEQTVAAILANAQAAQAVGLPISASDLQRRTSWGVPKDDADTLKPPQATAPPSPFGGALGFSETKAATIEPAKPIIQPITTFAEETPRSPAARRARRYARGAPIKFKHESPAPVDVAAIIEEKLERIPQPTPDPRIDKLSEQIADLAAKRATVVTRKIDRDSDGRIAGVTETTE